MDAALKREVGERAKGLCEYCRMPQAVVRPPFQIDHVMAQQHGGQTVLENLAFSCLHCNKHKGPNIAGIDSATGELARLFHPRRDQWEDHFEWAGALLIGRTGIGRATIEVLAINDAVYVAVRESLIVEGCFRLERASEGVAIIQATILGE